MSSDWKKKSGLVLSEEHPLIDSLLILYSSSEAMSTKKDGNFAVL